MRAVILTPGSLFSLEVQATREPVGGARGVDQAAATLVVEYVVNVEGDGPAALFEEVFYSVLNRVQTEASGHKFRFKNKLLSLDSTVLELRASMFDWARFRRTKGAVKLHLLLDHDGHLPGMALSRNDAIGDRNQEEKTGRFSTALQLGKGLRILSHGRDHPSRSRGGTASLIVVLPAGCAMMPGVMNSQKRSDWIVTLVCQPR